MKEENNICLQIRGEGRKKCKNGDGGGKRFKVLKAEKKVHVGSEAAHPSGRLLIERRNGRKYRKERERVYKTKHRKRYNPPKTSLQRLRGCCIIPLPVEVLKPRL